MAAKNLGYLLPDGEAFTDEMACTLVFYPDKPEYRQALGGSLGYLATWLAWERDADKRGQDAARAWKIALELTMECWEMACFEELTNDVASILTLLQNKKDCCDDSLTYLPQTEVETEIDPGVGDPPDYYGETAITDWDDWEEHVCFNAHAYVDYLTSIGYQLMQASQTSAIVIGLIAAGLALLSFSGIGLPIAFGLAAGIVSGIVLGGTITTFDDTASDIEAARDEILCALISGGDLADVVETALSSDTAWDLFFQFIDYDSAVAVIHEGGYDGEYLPTDTRDDCECVLPAGYNWVEAEEITYTLNPDTFGRVNEGSVSLPNITVGRKVATSASWGCLAYPAGCLTVNMKNSTYQTLAVRFTLISHTGTSGPWYDSTCRSDTDGDRHIWFYTLDVAEGIDAAWAAANSETYRVQSGGHAKRAIGYNWLSGEMNVSHSTPGQDPVEMVMKIEHLVWVT